MQSPPPFREGTADVLRRGYLLKEGAVHKNWKSRFFKLTSTTLSYHKSENTAALNSIPLSAVVSVASVEKKKLPNGFDGCVMIATNDRRLYVSATDPLLLDGWLTALKSAMLNFASSSPSEGVKDPDSPAAFIDSGDGMINLEKDPFVNEGGGIFPLFGVRAGANRKATTAAAFEEAENAADSPNLRIVKMQHYVFPVGREFISCDSDGSFLDSDDHPGRTDGDGLTDSTEDAGVDGVIFGKEDEEIYRLQRPIDDQEAFRPISRVFHPVPPRLVLNQMPIEAPSAEDSDPLLSVDPAQSAVPLPSSAWKLSLALGNEADALKIIDGGEHEPLKEQAATAARERTLLARKAPHLLRLVPSHHLSLRTSPVPAPGAVSSPVAPSAPVMMVDSPPIPPPKPSRLDLSIPSTGHAAAKSAAPTSAGALPSPGSVQRIRASSLDAGQSGGSGIEAGESRERKAQLIRTQSGPFGSIIPLQPQRVQRSHLGVSSESPFALIHSSSSASAPPLEQECVVKTEITSPEPETATPQSPVSPVSGSNHPLSEAGTSKSDTVSSGSAPPMEAGGSPELEAISELGSVVEAVVEPEMASTLDSLRVLGEGDAELYDVDSDLEPLDGVPVETNSVESDSGNQNEGDDASVLVAEFLVRDVSAVSRSVRLTNTDYLSGSGPELKSFSSPLVQLFPSPDVAPEHYAQEYMRRAAAANEDAVLLERDKLAASSVMMSRIKQEFADAQHRRSLRFQGSLRGVPPAPLYDFPDGSDPALSREDCRYFLIRSSRPGQSRGSGQEAGRCAVILCRPCVEHPGATTPPVHLRHVAERIVTWPVHLYRNGYLVSSAPIAKASAENRWIGHTARAVDDAGWVRVYALRHSFCPPTANSFVIILLVCYVPRSAGEDVVETADGALERLVGAIHASESRQYDVKKIQMIADSLYCPDHFFTWLMDYRNIVPKIAPRVAIAQRQVQQLCAADGLVLWGQVPEDTGEDADPLDLLSSLCVPSESCPVLEPNVDPPWTWHRRLANYVVYALDRAHQGFSGIRDLTAAMRHRSCRKESRERLRVLLNWLLRLTPTRMEEGNHQYSHSPLLAKMRDRRIMVGFTYHPKVLIPLLESGYLLDYVREATVHSPLAARLAGGDRGIKLPPLSFESLHSSFSPFLPPPPAFVMFLRSLLANHYLSVEVATIVTRHLNSLAESESDRDALAKRHLWGDVLVRLIQSSDESLMKEVVCLCSRRSEDGPAANHELISAGLAHHCSLWLSQPRLAPLSSAIEIVSTMTRCAVTSDANRVRIAADGFLEAALDIAACSDTALRSALTGLVSAISRVPDLRAEIAKSNVLVHLLKILSQDNAQAPLLGKVIECALIFCSVGTEEERLRNVLAVTHHFSSLVSCARSSTRGPLVRGILSLFVVIVKDTMAFATIRKSQGDWMSFAALLEDLKVKFGERDAQSTALLESIHSAIETAETKYKEAIVREQEERAESLLRAAAKEAEEKRKGEEAEKKRKERVRIEEERKKEEERIESARLAATSSGSQKRVEMRASDARKKREKKSSKRNRGTSSSKSKKK